MSYLMYKRELKHTHKVSTIIIPRAHARRALKKQQEHSSSWAYSKAGVCELHCMSSGWEGCRLWQIIAGIM